MTASLTSIDIFQGGEVAEVTNLGGRIAESTSTAYLFPPCLFFCSSSQLH